MRGYGDLSAAVCGSSPFRRAMGLVTVKLCGYCAAAHTTCHAHNTAPSRATLIYGCARRTAAHTTRNASDNAVFAPHSNIWWGVNKFCRICTEPPNGFGGEHPRVTRLYPKQIPFAETRNDKDNENRGVKKLPKQVTPLAHCESSGLNLLKQLQI